MLPLENRIIKKEDFTKIKKTGKLFFSGNIELKITKNHPAKTKIGFVVGRAFSKKATERNKTKRWAREALREQLPKLKNNADIIVIVKKKEKEPPAKKQLEENIIKALKKAGLISE